MLIPINSNNNQFHLRFVKVIPNFVKASYLNFPYYTIILTPHVTYLVFIVYSYALYQPPKHFYVVTLTIIFID